jgi:hypothetical protein
LNLLFLNKIDGTQLSLIFESVIFDPYVSRDLAARGRLLEGFSRFPVRRFSQFIIDVAKRVSKNPFVAR